MVRSQIYITENQKICLQSYMTQYKKKQSELLREAIDLLIQKYQEKYLVSKQKKALKRVQGMWKGRDIDLGDIRKDEKTRDLYIKNLFYEKDFA